MASVSLTNLDRFLSEVTHEAAKRSIADERATALSLSADYAARLEEKALFRRLLTSDELDAARFRWWFDQPHNRDAYDLDGWRRRIDAQMLKEENGK